MLDFLDRLSQLNAVQQDIVNSTEGAVLVSAGAGSGKTRVLTMRITNQIRSGINANEILAITFTNKATNEMKERISKDTNDIPFISTIHGFCAWLLRNEIEILGYKKNFTIYDDSDTTKLLKSILKKAGDEDEMNEILSHFSNISNNRIDAEEYFTSLKNGKGTKFFQYYEEYCQSLKQNNAVDFDGLLSITYLILKSYPQVLQKYQERFKYISVDEFQDTNKVQADIVFLLASKYSNLFVVGDEDQCIYGWRGANINNLLEFQKKFPNCKIFKLEQNYRSTNTILKEANEIIKKNTMRFNKVLYTNNDSGEQTIYKCCYSENEEADFVSKTIITLVNSGYKYSDFAILLRLNALSRNFEERFLNYNIPYRLFGGFKFFERAEIKNILSYLKLLVNPQDSSALSRIVTFPKQGIGEATLSEFMEYAHRYNLSYVDLLCDINGSALPDKIKSKFYTLSNLYTKLLQSKKESLPVLLQTIILDAKIKEQFQEKTEENKNKLMNIDSLIQSVDENTANMPNLTPESYLEMITLSNDIDNYNENTNCVTLATIHAVKGLEFKVVFVVALEEGIMPLVRIGKESEREEERRLMYVAITRAEKQLILTRAKSRFLNGKRTLSSASTFLKELNLEHDYFYDNFASAEAQQKFQTTKQLLSAHKTISSPKLQSGVDYSKFVLNSRVQHPKFGVGVIVDNSEIHTTKCVKIEFPDYGIKNLIVDFAPLQFV